MSLNGNFSTRVNPYTLYSPIDPAFRENVPEGTAYRNTAGDTFGGTNYHIYFGNRKVANLDTLTISMTVETVGQYAMGSPDPLGHIQGKRALVGSMSMHKWDRHALLDEVFNLKLRNKRLTQGQLFSPDSPGAQLSARGTQTYTVAGESGNTGGVGNPKLKVQSSDEALQLLNNTTARGLSVSAQRELLSSQVQEAAESAARRLIKYSDQLPPFDATITGVSKTGNLAYTRIYGIQIMQETDAWSIQDLNGMTALSFVALSWDPWTSLSDSEEFRTI